MKYKDLSRESKDNANAAKRERYKILVKSGFCPKHPKNKNEPGYSCCKKCLDLKVGYNLNRKLNGLENGNCTHHHIIPRSKGGPNSIENLQWVDLDINNMKYNRDHREFLIFCKQICEYAGIKR